MKRDGILYTVIFSFVVGFVFVSGLAVVNEGTRSRVELNQTLARQRAVLSAFGIEYSSPEEVLSLYERNVRTVKRGSVELLESMVNGEKAYAHMFTENALWGNVYGVLAVNEDTTRIVGLEIIEHNETPGLGGRIEEPWFKNQFRNEKINNGRITVNTRPSGSADDNPDNATVDAITGATLTSRYMQDIVNAGISFIKKALEV